MKTRYYVGTLLMAFLTMGVLAGVSCPGGIVIPSTADLVTGGVGYDKWWVAFGATEPTTDHPLWASRPDTTSNSATGSATWRCKECHGWDYKGKDGAYGTGSHKTGIIGIFGTTKTDEEVFNLLKDDAATTTKGHGFGTAGLSDANIWDLVKFVQNANGAQFDTDSIITSGDFDGTAATGMALYDGPIGTNTLACKTCHGADGGTINFKTCPDQEFIGDLASDNPWEFQHKVRFGQPGEAMPSSITGGGTAQNVADVGAYAETLTGGTCP